MLLRLLLLATLLALPACAQKLIISHIPYEGRLLYGRDHIFIAVKDLTRELNLKLLRTGFGYWAGYSPPDILPSVPRGKVMVGTQILPMLQVEDSKDWYVSAEAFCLASGGKAQWTLPAGDLALTRPTRPEPKYVEPEETAPSVTLPKAVASRKPEDFYITQYKSAENPDGNPTNGNCGPTTLAMAALAHNALPPGIQPSNRQGLILWCRECMTGNSLDQEEGTRLIQMRKAARELGMQTSWVDDVDALDWELRKGRLVAVGGDVARLGFKFRGQEGGHALMVVGRTREYYVVNDPGGFYPLAGAHMPLEDMKKFFGLGVAFLPKSPVSQRGD